MPQMIFVNLPVDDVAKSTAFYEAIGAKRDLRFSNEHASAMQWSDTIMTMLLQREFFATFTAKRIADAHATTESLTCLSRDSRAQVDETADLALAAGAREPRAAQDYGMMYARSIEDPDGHIIELMWMDVDAFLASQPSSALANA